MKATTIAWLASFWQDIANPLPWPSDAPLQVCHAHREPLSRLKHYTNTRIPKIGAYGLRMIGSLMSSVCNPYASVLLLEVPALHRIVRNSPRLSSLRAFRLKACKLFDVRLNAATFMQQTVQSEACLYYFLDPKTQVSTTCHDPFVCSAPRRPRRAR